MRPSVPNIYELIRRTAVLTMTTKNSEMLYMLLLHTAQVPFSIGQPLFGINIAARTQAEQIHC